jgi:hypothetical protein
MNCNTLWEKEIGGRLSSPPMRRRNRPVSHARDGDGFRKTILVRKNGIRRVYGFARSGC